MPTLHGIVPSAGGTTAPLRLVFRWLHRADIMLPFK